MAASAATPLHCGPSRRRARRRRRAHDQHFFEAREVHRRPHGDLVVLADAAIDLLDGADHEPLRIDAVDPRRHDQVAGLHVGRAGHVLHPQRAVANADHYALHARALDQRASGGVAIDQQLHFRGAAARQDHAADDAGRRNHRHVGREPSDDALVDGHGAEIGLAAPAITSAAAVSRLARSRSSSSWRRLSVRCASARSCCSRTCSDCSSCLSALFSLLDLAQGDVAGPQAAHAVDHRRGAALHF